MKQVIMEKEMIVIKNRYTGSVMMELKTLVGANLRCENLKDTDLRNADLRNANLSYTDLRNADLSGANLSYTDLRNANLSYTDLSGADLRDTDLRNANLSYTDSRNAILRNADLRNADLRGADLRDTDLRNADLRNADLSGADLSGAAVVLMGLKWNVYITNGHIRIGCQSHDLSIWQGFSDSEIAKMDEKASEFWSTNKQWIISTCQSLTKE